MPAMIERHLKDQKPSLNNVPAKETILCPIKGCEFSYTIFYTEDDGVPNDSEVNVHNMRLLAVALIDKAHPVHRTKKHIWKGTESGWVEADSMAAGSTQ
jgi:hypothetical protein